MDRLDRAAAVLVLGGVIIAAIVVTGALWPLWFLLLMAALV